MTKEDLLTCTSTEIITDKYIFSRRFPSKLIVLAEVAWVYHHHIRFNRGEKNVIVLCMNNGKKKEMPYRLSLTDSDMYNLIKIQNPQVMIGKSA